jgi:hypothetical protein
MKSKNVIGGGEQSPPPAAADVNAPPEAADTKLPEAAAAPAKQAKKTNKGKPTKKKATPPTKKPAPTKNKKDAADTTTAVNKLTNALDFDKAVIEGKAILAKIDVAERGYYRLGELAASVETQYSKKSLANFAGKLGLPAGTLERYRNVWRAWDGANPPIPAPERFSYAVLKELATHDNKQKIIFENEQLTKRKAQGIMRDYREAKANNAANNGNGKDNGKEKDKDWKAIVAEHKRWLNRLYRHSVELLGYARVADQPMTADQLLYLRAGIEKALLPPINKAFVEGQILTHCLTQLNHQEPEDIRRTVAEPTTLAKLYSHATTPPDEQPDTEETDSSSGERGNPDEKEATSDDHDDDPAETDATEGKP